MRRRTAFFLCLLGLGLLGLTVLFFPTRRIRSVTAIPAYLRPEVAAVMEKINPDSIHTVMSILASDSFEGRQPGTRGFAMASDYVQHKMKAMGLLPGMDSGSFVQPVLLKKGKVTIANSSLHLGDESLVYGQDFLFRPCFYQPVSAVTAPLVFVGYGVYAPELHYDDYGKTDVKGCIVVILDAAPAIFPSNERAYFSSTATKYAEAVKRGAVGVINLPATATHDVWEAMVKRADQGVYRWADTNGTLQPDFPELKVIATLNAARATNLFKSSGHDLPDIAGKAKAGQPQSFRLGKQASMQVTTTLSDVHTSNLIGVIPGSSPLLKDQYVVYVAHLDHFGIGAPVKGDSIYNGAHDNASGVALLLEIARTFRSLPSPPKRSVIIAIVTGEELGLLGSDYFIHHSTVPRKDIVANLTLDMPFFFHPVLDIVPYGIDHSTLSRQTEAAAAYLGLDIGPDPFPEQTIFIRSDHYSFIRQGIPALFIKSGFKTVPFDLFHGRRSDLHWRNATYHTPQDDMSQTFNFNAAATHVKLNFLIGLLVCEDTDRPAWNKGDFFGGRFGGQ
jgi:Zn-dependent M28 family amino/carboxypeptidase